MNNSLTQLLKSRDLLWSWTVRTLRGRYQQSALGWLWAIIQPLASVLIFTIVFTNFVRVETSGVPYILFSYLAVAPWTLFSSSIGDMTNSLVSNMSLVGKIYFPREILPVSALLARLADFGISMVLLAFMIFYYHLPISVLGLMYLPVIVAIQLAFILGVGIGSAALNVFYRDVDPLLRLIIQVWFYATPIIYPIAMVPEKWRSLYLLNPMAGIIESYRDVLVYNRVPGPYLVPSAIVSIAILLLGYWYFKRVEYHFADII